MKSIKQVKLGFKLCAFLFSLLYLALAKALCLDRGLLGTNFSGLLQVDFSLGFLVILCSIALLMLCAWLVLFNMRVIFLSGLLWLVSSLIPQSSGLLKDLHVYGTLLALLLYLYPFLQGFLIFSLQEPNQPAFLCLVKNLSYFGQVCFGVLVIALLSFWLYGMEGYITKEIQFFFVGGLSLWLSLLSFESYPLCM